MLTREMSMSGYLAMLLGGRIARIAILPSVKHGCVVEEGLLERVVT